MQIPYSPQKIGIMGFFGYGNLGDAALQEAMIQHIRAHFPDANIYGFSLVPEDTEARHGIKSFPISRLSGPGDVESSHRLTGRLANWLRSRPNPIFHKLERWVIRLPMEFNLFRDALKHLKGFDALIVSGSGPLNDYWGGGGAFSFPYTLMKWGVAAKLQKTKFLFVSVGAGPINSRLSQLFIRYTLSLADYRSFRDEFSRQLIRRIGFKREVPVYPDLAYSLPIGNTVAAKYKNSRPIVGIGPMGYFKKGCWPEDNETLYADYLDKMTAFVTWLLEKQYDILFLPGEAHFDQLVIGDLIESLEHKRLPDLKEHLLRPAVLTVDELISNLRITDYVVASRFHNVLLAQLVGKPVLAISYQEKIEDLMMEMGQIDYCVAISQFRVEDLRVKFAALETHHDTIVKEVEGKSRDYQAALNEQYEKIFQII